VTIEIVKKRMKSPEQLSGECRNCKSTYRADGGDIAHTCDRNILELETTKCLVCGKGMSVVWQVVKKVEWVDLPREIDFHEGNRG